ncbi:MAG: hypothetical protein GY750_15170 [Lentisphaerae bacterium]|nr:hypothetical protein [Lentisphaerota bacterium]MCP4102739.1 hypothetical protein [Lentisphaerota bacterium]
MNKSRTLTSSSVHSQTYGNANDNNFMLERILEVNIAKNMLANISERNLELLTSIKDGLAAGNHFNNIHDFATKYRSQSSKGIRVCMTSQYLCRMVSAFIRCKNKGISVQNKPMLNYVYDQLHQVAGLDDDYDDTQLSPELFKVDYVYRKLYQINMSAQKNMTFKKYRHADGHEVNILGSFQRRQLLMAYPYLSYSVFPDGILPLTNIIYYSQFFVNSEYSRNVFLESGNYAVQGISGSTHIALYGLTAFTQSLSKKDAVNFLCNVVMPYLVVTNSHSFGECFMLLITMNMLNEFIPASLVRDMNRCIIDNEKLENLDALKNFFGNIYNNMAAINPTFWNGPLADEVFSSTTHDLYKLIFNDYYYISRTLNVLSFVKTKRQIVHIIPLIQHGENNVILQAMMNILSLKDYDALRKNRLPRFKTRTLSFEKNYRTTETFSLLNEAIMSRQILNIVEFAQQQNCLSILTSLIKLITFPEIQGDILTYGFLKSTFSQKLTRAIQRLARKHL